MGEVQRGVLADHRGARAGQVEGRLLGDVEELDHVGLRRRVGGGPVEDGGQDCDLDARLVITQSMDAREQRVAADAGPDGHASSYTDSNMRSSGLVLLWVGPPRS
jgi:hypothetical protein